LLFQVVQDAVVKWTPLSGPVGPGLKVEAASS
jgi:hypothetical protein